MGSWSVYCSISRIAITSGRKCVFLPLIENKSLEGYDRMIPATLPIFGEYNDYGGIENIKEDVNTKLIEEMFGHPIQEFCDFITDNRRDFDDEYSDWHGKEDLKPIEKMTYTWIDREVWEFMKNYHPAGFGRQGDFDLGNPEFLKAAGFEFIGETDDKRFNKHYRYTNGEVIIDIKADGTWAHTLDNGSIYRIQDLKKLGVDTTKFDGKEEHQMFELFDYKTRVDKLGYVIGVPRGYLHRIEMDAWLETVPDVQEKLKANRLKAFEGEHIDEKTKAMLIEMDREREEEVKNRKTSILHRYVMMMENNDLICNMISDLHTVKHNMYCASTSWEPYVLYMTPQCGEHKIHQKMLEAFAQINNEIVKSCDYDEDEE